MVKEKPSGGKGKHWRRGKGEQKKRVTLVHWRNFERTPSVRRIRKAHGLGSKRRWVQASLVEKEREWGKGGKGDLWKRTRRRRDVRAQHVVV